MTFNPLQDRDGLDTFTLAGETSPGICFFEDLSSPRGWDEQQGFGTDGASLRWKGDGLPEFSVRIQCFTDQHFADWANFRHLVKKSPPGVPPKAMEIRHPQTEELEIRSVVVTDEGGWTQADDGVWEISIKFKQYRKPKPAVAAPAGPIDDPKNDNSAQDATDRQIAILTGQLTALQQQDAKTP